MNEVKLERNPELSKGAKKSSTSTRQNNLDLSTIHSSFFFFFC